MIFKKINEDMNSADLKENAVWYFSSIAKSILSLKII